MSNYGTDALHVPIDFNHDVEVDDDGISYLISNVYVGGEEEPQEIRVPMDEVVESLCEHYGDVAGYQHLYVAAHEFSRAAEALREKAGLIEDSVSAVSDLFDLTDDWRATFNLP